MSLEGKMFNACGHPFGIVMQPDSLMEFFFFDSGCLGKMTASKKEVMVVEMVVGMVGRVLLANLGVLMEVVILVQLMVRYGGGADGGSAVMGGGGGACVCSGRDCCRLPGVI